MGITGQIANHMRRRSKGLLQMDVKWDAGQLLFEGRLQREGRKELGKKQAAEDRGKRFDGEEKVLGSMDKGRARSRQTASRNEHMEMRVKLKGLTPGMENRGKARREAEKALGSSQRRNGLRCRGKEGIQTDIGMPQKERTKLCGNGKDHMIVGNRKSLGMELRGPGLLPGMLADGTMAIRAGMEHRRIGTAIGTGGKKAAHLRGTAGRNMTKHFDLLPGNSGELEKVFFEKREDLLYAVRQGDHLRPDPQDF